MQANILQKKSISSFVSCAAHRSNHASVYAASLNNAAISLFGIVQNIFAFFLVLRSRWEILMNML
jgi:hypothetical protein